MTGVQTLTVGSGEGGQRLDRWFRRRFPQIPQGRIEKMCRKGEIRVDGARAKPATRIEDGQSVRIPPLPENDAPAPPVQPRVTEADAKMIRAAVLYRDDHLIAINKPAGLPTQGGSGHTRHVDGLAEALTFDSLRQQPRLVQTRLATRTLGRGCCCAHAGQAAQGPDRDAPQQSTRKIYWAVTAGVPATQRMGTNPHRAGGRRRVTGTSARGGEKMPDSSPP